MRELAGVCVCLFVLGSAAALAGPAAQPSPIEKARAEVERAGVLVEAGALPRARLEDLKRNLADAEDEEILNRSLYGNVSVDDLNEDQAEEMLAAAQRRLDRQKAQIEKSKQLVEDGVLARMALYPALEELDRRRKTMDLAVSRLRVLQELAAMVRAEEALAEQLAAAPPAMGALPVAERFDGTGVFRLAQIKEIMRAYEKEFLRAMPISAMGTTRLHKALGFDHRDRVDVALNPDQTEGVWLRRYLETAGIPYFAFRSAVPGKSTAPHIHIGPPSTRLRIAD